MENEVRKYHKERSDVSQAQRVEEILNEIEYKKKHRELTKHWEFPSGFPSQDVADGYLKPNIIEIKEDSASKNPSLKIKQMFKDDDNELELTWGLPDYKALKELALNKLKWHPHEIRNTLVETEKKRPKGWNFNTQKKIADYFNKQHKFAHFKSKRILSAIGKIRKKQEKKNKST